MNRQSAIGNRQWTHAISSALMRDVPSPAALPSGTRLAHYEIAGLIGTGGMGQVYRAHDLKLQRDVALKLLPQEMAADPERRQRFEREARAVAALNHPGIVTIHSVDDVDGRMFLTMELVSGRPISEIIPRGGLGLDRLLAIAVPLMEAVSAAHARGITHRDLKPANVMVTAEGQVKVLDFGLAKPADTAATAEPTVTGMPDVITGQGRILGTIAYMSPEQAEGKPIDARSDVFSLGVMLYEMATGERPFKGETSVSTLAAIMRDVPRPATELNTAIPKELWRVIRRALEKDPDRRQQNAKDLRNELEDLRRELESGELVSAGAAPPPGTPTSTPASSSTDALASASAPRAAMSTPAAAFQAAQPARGTPRWVWAVSALGVIVGVVAAARWWPGASGSPGGTAGSGVRVESVVSLTSEDGVEMFPSLSPDGRWVVYAADERGSGQLDILLRAVGGQNVINLTKDSTADDSHPAFSPDGERIAFWSSRDSGGLYVMGRTGESVRRVSDQGYSPAWSPDGGSLAYVLEPVGQPYGRSTNSQLWKVDVSTGARTQLPVEDAMQPAWSPQGQRIVYWGLLGDSVQRDLWTVAPAGGEPVRLTNDAAVDWSPVWSPDGRHVYYASDGSGRQNVWRIGVDEASGQPRGRPEPITLPRQFLGHLSFAADGSTLAASSIGTTSNLELLNFDMKTGTVSGRRRVTNVSETTSAPSLSPDGKAILFYRLANGQEDLWLVARDGTGLRQLTNDAAHDRNPQFLPDGRRLLFYSDRGGRYQIWTMGLDGGDTRQVTDVPSLAIQARVTGDGTRAFANLPLTRKNILFDPGVAAAEQQIEEMPAYPDGLLFRATSWSPDGTRIAGDVLGTATGGVAIYDVKARRFTSVTKSGVGGAWLPDGRRILYRSGDPRALDIVDTETGTSRRVFELPREVIGAVDISSDGREIVAVIVNRQSDIVLAKLSTER